MNARRLGRIAKRYDRETLGPLVRAIRSAGGLKDLQRRLGPGLFRKMKTGALEEAMTDASVQAGLIGRVSAMPKRVKSEESVVKSGA